MNFQTYGWGLFQNHQRCRHFADAPTTKTKGQRRQRKKIDTWKAKLKDFRFASQVPHQGTRTQRPESKRPSELS